MKYSSTNAQNSLLFLERSFRYIILKIKDEKQMFGSKNKYCFFTSGILYNNQDKP